MPSYRAPLRDMRFVFEELLDAYTLLQTLPEQREFTADLGGAILEEAAKLAENVLAPLNGPGDKQGCQYAPQTRSVRTPDGFKAAYQQFAEGGWTSLAWLWSQQAQLAQRQLDAGSSETHFYAAKIKSADFFMARILPEADALLSEIKAGKATLMAITDEEFAA